MDDNDKVVILEPEDIIEYVRDNVKINDILEVSYNRIYAPGTVLGLTPEDPETGAGLTVTVQLNGEILNQTVDIDLKLIKDEILEIRHMPEGNEDKLVIVEAVM